MTLHLAMEQVLADADEPLTAREIADLVNARGLYTRSDGAQISASQISARSRRYPHQFVTENGRIRLANQYRRSPISTSLIVVDATPRRATSLAPALADSASVDVLLDDDRFRIAGEVDELVPQTSGLYAIRVREFDCLPEPFRSEAIRREDRLIYLGEAKTSLRSRLLHQELRARGHGTFFRSLGAVLGYRPEPGSLIGKRNQRNYTFTSSDEQAIINWIDRNLEVSWLPFAEGVHTAEVALIRDHGPLLNLQGNPRRMPELTRLRALCCNIATAPPASTKIEP